MDEHCMYTTNPVTYTRVTLLGHNIDSLTEELAYRLLIKPYARF